MMYEEGLTNAVLPTPAVPDTAEITTVPPRSARPRSSPVSVASSPARPAKCAHSDGYGFRPSVKSHHILSNVRFLSEGARRCSGQPQILPAITS